MESFDVTPFLLPYLIANVVAALMLAASIRIGRWARWAFILLFAWASFTNASISTRNPSVYLEYADLTFLPAYRSVILGAFNEHITLYVTIIAVCQALIALGLLLGGPLARIAAWGAIAFLVAIAPLGVGSGFPCTLMLAAGLFILLKHGMRAPAWHTAQRKRIAT